MASISVIDLSPVSNANGRIPTESDWAIVTDQVSEALHNVGFVYLVNHDVPIETIKTAFEESKGFFTMPVESKTKYAKDVSKGFHGWAQPNQEKLKPDSTYELRESFDFYKGKLLFPEPEVKNFQESIANLQLECKQLIRKLLRIFAKTLKLPDDEFFINCHQGALIPDSDIPSFSTFRALFYPTIPSDIPAGTVRCGEHSDYGMLTLLFQDDQGGLEVKGVNDKWLPANPVPGAILVNTGDLLEQWSGGYFPATVHRVLIPETELKKKSTRLSMVYFVHPDDETIVKPLLESSVVTTNGQHDFEPVTAYDHCRRKLDQTYSY